MFQLSGSAEYNILEGFGFILLDHDVVNDIMTYNLSYIEFCALLIVYGIDSDDPCGPESNVVLYILYGTMQNSSPS